MKKKFLEDLTADEKRRIIQDVGGDTEHLLAILLELQSRSKRSYIDEETAAIVGDELGLSLAHVHDAITFYEMLETEPSARYLINVCNSVACYFSKGERAVDLLKEELGISPGEITEDGLFAIRYCSCVGACEKAPVMKINDEVYGSLTREKVHEIITGLRAR